MIKALLFLVAIGLAQSSFLRRLTEPHPDCPMQDHHLLPHEYDCTKFYYCEWGEKYIEPRDCPLGTEFSPHINVCIHPTLADCQLPGYSTTSSSTTPSTTTTSTTTTTPTTTTTTPTTTTPTTTTTTTTPTTTTTTTTPTTTTTTTTPTTTTTTSTTTTPTTTTTSPTTTTTTSTTTTPTTTTTTPTTTTTTPTTTTTTPTTTTTTPTTTSTTASSSSTTTASSSTVAPDSCEYLDNGCPADFGVIKLLPHETSCRNFYFCVRGERVLRRCARGLVFNPIIENCDHPYNVDRTCEDDDFSSEEVPPVDDGNQGPVELFPNGCPVNYNISMYLPHDYYCNLYYQCSFGQLIERRCPPGTHFNATGQSCDHIGELRCTLPGGNAPETPTTTTAPWSPSTPEPPTDFLPNGCPTDYYYTWHLPHVDCTKFYYCVWGHLVEAACTGGLHFNPVIQTCDNPATAGCANNPCSNPFYKNLGLACMPQT